MTELSEDFEDFLDYESDVFQRIEDRYSEELRQLVENQYTSQIPKGDIKPQVRWLESRFHEISPEFYEEKFSHPYLNDIYSSLLPQNVNEAQNTVIHTDPLNSYREFENYDAIVLDHCIIFEILEKGDRSYYLDGLNTANWIDTMNTLDEAQKRSEIYVPSDLNTKTNRKDKLGQVKPAKLFIEGFKNLDLDQEIQIPSGHNHLEEDLLIGSQAEKIGENALILTYDSDFFSAVPHHYDIESSVPIVEE